MTDDNLVFAQDAVYVVDEVSEKKQDIQGRDFLWTGVKPVIGQRVDLTFIQPTGGPTFLLAGQVMSIEDEPSGVWAMKSCDDSGIGKKGSAVISGDILPINVATVTLEKVGQGHPMPSHIFGYLSQWKWMTHYCRECGIHSKDISEVPEESVSIVYENYKSKYAVLHGQEVICEGRLHFEQDMLRCDEDGPWVDAIPFDGRDIWQFTLVFNDTKNCKWVLKPNSFKNLGRERHPRCWPWNNDDTLPYERPEIYRRGPRPFQHLCIGPMGCDGEGHSHGYDGGAA